MKIGDDVPLMPHFRIDMTHPSTNQYRLSKLILAQEMGHDSCFFN
jgi:hypothetical protein